MMRDFRYLRVTESSTDWLASCNLLTDGVYMKYMKITKEIREKRNSEEKNYRSLNAPFFQQIKTYFETLLRKSLSSSD